MSFLEGGIGEMGVLLPQRDWKRKFDGLPPHLQLSNPEVEKSECWGEGCSGDLGSIDLTFWCMCPHRPYAFLCVMLLVWVFKLG